MRRQSSTLPSGSNLPPAAESFFSRLASRACQAGSLLCVGLDPHPSELPVATGEAVESFCLRLIDETAELAAAFKPNAAFFEVYGSEGIAVLSRVIEAVPEGIPVILDAKRGDIATTAQVYAKAIFHTLKADAVTINPYLGYDALSPFMENPEKGVFLLCKTSNPGASDLQDLLVTGQPEAFASHGVSRVNSRTVYETVAQLAQTWNTRDNLGLVVGATHPQALACVRALAPDLWILAPGVGVQGGDLEAALRAGLRRDGMGLLVPVSRRISRAADPRQTARSLRDEINRIRSQQPSANQHQQFKITNPESKTRGDLSVLADNLLEAGCVKFGEFTLKSGVKSPIYLDLRQLVSFPDILDQVARAYLPILRRLSFDRLAALPYAGLPIGTAISLMGGWPLVYPRKETKEYGTRAEIEGYYEPGERVVIIDDLATTGGSKFEAIEKLEAVELRVIDVVVLIDRSPEITQATEITQAIEITQAPESTKTTVAAQSGVAQALAQRGYHFHSVFRLAQLLEHWQSCGRISGEQVAAVIQFLAGASS